MSQHPTPASGLPANDRPVDAEVIDLTVSNGRDVVVPHTRYTRVAKPILDRILALEALIVLSPLLLLATAITLVSLGRPMLLKQTRIGYRGESFTVYKFRTMVPDRRRLQLDYIGSDRRTSHKRAEDPRITRGGRFMRRFSLDELPQLVNVLRGEMSMVGPRPELPSIVARHYRDLHHQRHLVKPGLTGLWQVSARGSSVMHHRVDLDLDYVENVSVRTDLGILMRTLPAALMTNQGI